VREGEGRDGGENARVAAHDQQQREHKQQMIDATQNMFDSEPQVRPSHLAHAGWRLDDKRRSLGH